MGQEVGAATRAWLDGVRIDDAVARLRVDYRTVIVVAEGLQAGPGDARSEALLRAAEELASRTVSGSPQGAGSGSRPAPGHPHLDAWRAAFDDFGAKPSRTRPSVDALLRRLPSLPRIDRLTDLYNAISIAHVVPIGGEDLDQYAGAAVLTRATGDESFGTTANGEPVIDHPAPGEVIWRDNTGVTCRRWNWRQCTRTRLSATTTRAVFIIDALTGIGDTGLHAAASDLAGVLSESGPDVALAQRIIRASDQL